MKLRRLRQQTSLKKGGIRFGSTIETHRLLGNAYQRNFRAELFTPKENIEILYTKCTRTHSVCVPFDKTIRIIDVDVQCARKVVMDVKHILEDGNDTFQ